MLKKIFIFLLLVFIVIQFFHPKPNKASGEQPNFIGKLYAIPEDIKPILEKACNDCHSNNTRYPWYSNIQPVDWWLTKHINDGKRHFNFDDFTGRTPRYQYNKLDELVEQVKAGDMPISSYTWIHKDAILSAGEKTSLINWAEAMRDSMKAKYPIDSLLKRKK
ncbi:MAG: heme-binding domain-containing protein [Bacteroidota bacterium]|nr:heme-binding domain-containing protein [Bacteroidota bacterium]